MSSLINPVLKKTSFFERLALNKPIPFLNGMSASNIVFNFVLPLVCVVVLTFVLKRRHRNWKHARSMEDNDPSGAPEDGENLEILMGLHDS